METSGDVEMTSGQSIPAAPGILTRTIVQSPVVHWVLTGSLRDSQHVDVVFVGGDFVEVKSMNDDCALEPIVKKTDISGRICAAALMEMSPFDHRHSDLVKIEPSERHESSKSQQGIVLVLDTDCIYFLWLESNDRHEPCFEVNFYPVPRFSDTVYQPRQHLSVDPYSRAFAVAACEAEVVLYTVHPKANDTSDSLKDGVLWGYVSSERIVRIVGAVQLMQFLTPADDDQDHVVLLLITIDQGTAKAVLIDWYHTSSLRDAQVHSAIPLDTAIPMPTLLVPLPSAAFLLIFGTNVRQYKDILSGSIDYSNLEYDGKSDRTSALPGASPQAPIWTSWCRPNRDSARLSSARVYLSREDGMILVVDTSSARPRAKHLGRANCHIGSAFAALRTNDGFDILAVAGDTSPGCILSVAQSGTGAADDEMDMGDVEGLDMIEIIPNWASVTDMVTTNLSPGRLKRSRDAIFVTSGRQPYGAITEIRHGLEARLSLYFELPGLESVNDIWAFPLSFAGYMLVMLSSPSLTRLLTIPLDSDMENVEELDSTDTALDSTHRTLAAALSANGSITQVTENAICVTGGRSLSTEDSRMLQVPEDTTILSADIDTDGQMVAAAERKGIHPAEYNLISYAFRDCDPGAMIEGQREILKISTQNLPSEPLCVKFVANFIFVATTYGTIEVFGSKPEDSFTHRGSHRLPFSEGSPGLCDHIAPLKSSRTESSFLLLCGLRDGRLYYFKISSSTSIRDDFGLPGKCLTLGQTSVRLKQTSAESPAGVLAMIDSDICLLSWDDKKEADPSVQSIWITDRERPHLAQATIRACTQIPSAALKSPPGLSGSLILISENEFLVTELSSNPTTVPRQLRVSGTPTRVIYAEQQRSIVSASLCYGVRRFPTPQGRPEERRQIWPVIDFIPTRTSEVSFSFKLQPGERVYALLEWSLRLDDGKTYSFILVGGSYVSSSGRPKGRVYFLQPLVRNWKVHDVNEGRSLKFEQPIYALALLDDVTFVACSGTYVYVYRFAPEDVKWRKLCEPLSISSVGINITIKQTHIYISTAQDSLVILSFLAVENRSGEPRWELRFDCAAPRADALLSHIIPAIEPAVQQPGPEEIVITTTKHGQVTGLQQTTNGDDRARSSSVKIAFETLLPKSLTRIRQGSTRPPWRRPPPNGVLANNLIGCATDGTLVNISLLSDDLFRRLQWLQQLCVMSPLFKWTRSTPKRLDVLEPLNTREHHSKPIGIAADRTTETLLPYTATRFRGREVDGDILARLQEQGGSELLHSMIQAAAEREDPVGDWMREHLQEELQAVDEVMDLLSALLESCI